MIIGKLQFFVVIWILLFYNSIEITGKDSKEKHNVTVNGEPEIENPEYITNGKNVVGPEVVYVGKHFQNITNMLIDSKSNIFISILYHT